MSQNSKWWMSLSSEEWGNLPRRKFEEMIADPAFQIERDRRKAETEDAQRARKRRLDLEEEPINIDLRAIGISARLGEMDSTGSFDERSYPVLAKHLENHGYSDWTLWPLISAFRNNRAHGKPMSFKLEQLARSGRYSPQATFWLWDAVAENLTSKDHARMKALAEDVSIGDHRELFFRRLRMTKHPEAREILERLSADPSVAREARDQLALLEKAERKRTAEVTGGP